MKLTGKILHEAFNYQAKFEQLHAETQEEWNKAAERLNNLQEMPLQGATNDVNRAGDPIQLRVDEKDHYYSVVWLGLVGYDSVEMFVNDAEEARALYQALLCVREVEED